MNVKSKDSPNTKHQEELLKRLRHRVTNLIQANEDDDATDWNQAHLQLKHLIGIHGGDDDDDNEYGIPADLIDDYRVEPLSSSAQRIERLLNNQQQARNSGQRRSGRHQASSSRRRSSTKSSNVVAPLYTPLVLAQLCLKLTEQWLERRKFLIQTRLQQFLQSIRTVSKNNTESTTHTANQLEALRRLQQDLILLQQLTDDLYYTEQVLGVQLQGITNRADWKQEESPQDETNVDEDKDSTQYFQYEEEPVMNILLQWQVKLKELNTMLANIRVMLNKQHKQQLQNVYNNKHIITGGGDGDNQDDTELKQYIEVQLMKQDTFGKLYRVKRNNEKQWITLKVITLPTMTREQQKQDAEMELDLVKQIQCDSNQWCAIIPIYKHWYSKNLLYIESKYLPHDGFNIASRDIIPVDGMPEANNHTVPSLKAVQWIRMNLLRLSQSLQHIHQCNILHRDIKPESLLYDADTKQLYFSDFGLSCVQPLQCQQHPMAGTPNYMDPLIFSNKQAPDQLSDVYALGLTMYVILSGKSPFTVRYDPKRIYYKILATLTQWRKQYKTMPEALQLFDLLEHMTHPFDKTQRPPLRTIIHTLQ